MNRGLSKKKSSRAVLHLHLCADTFAEIAAGTKRVEYRKRTEHWRRRIEGRKFDVVLFRNGYAKGAPEMVVEIRGIRREGRGRNAYYAIRLGRMLKVRR